MPSSTPENALHKCLADLDLPLAMFPAVWQNYQACDSHLVVIDNSSLMKVKDSHIGRNSKDGRIKQISRITRWDELQEAMSFNCKLASKCWVPTKYWFLNEPTGLTAGYSKKFSLCWGSPKDVPGEMNHIKHMMKSATLDQRRCELTSRISHISKIIGKESSRLGERGKNITVIFYTQGLPTNGKGQTGTTVRQELRSEMWSLTKLPVNVIVRLCTDDEKVTSMFNDMDNTFDSFDVLDDYWGEAMEVYLHNPWLTYSKGLHRLREVGLAPDVLGDLDQRSLTLDEIHQLCIILFAGEGESVYLPLPPYQPTSTRQLGRSSWVESWIPFIVALEGLVEKEKLQWNPITKRMAPWIDLKKLQSNLKSQFEESSDRFEARRSFAHANPPGRRPARHGHRGRDPAGDKGFGRSPPAMSPIHENKPQTDSGLSDLTLEEAIQRWSHQPPNYKRANSLQRLLITVPRAFPPMNHKVEEHEYFSKWKTFDKEAFSDVCDEGLKSLLHRAARKAKFFLHPDKLPKDLTENQTILFSTIWNVIAEQEAAIFG